MLERTDQAELIAARLRDFFLPKTPWPRRLWTPGLLATLREVPQAAKASRDGILSQGALTDLCRRASGLALQDPAVPQTYRQPLKDCLEQGLAYQNGRHHRLVELTALVEASYLNRWSQALRDGSSSSPGLELAARSIASYLVDQGFSAPFLLTWWSRRIADEQTTWGIADLVEEAHGTLATAGERRFEVVIPFLSAGKFVPVREWMTAADAARWIEEHKLSSIRQNGALRLEISAKDAFAAVEEATVVADRLRSRGTVMGGGGLVPHTHALVAGQPDPIVLRHGRNVHVGALGRLGNPLDPTPLPLIDAALALVAPLQRQQPTAAVAGAWAALESLLTGPGEAENVLAADRMAALVACSLPRAELTRLARAHTSTAQDELTTELRAASSNQQRCRVLLDALHRERPVHVPTASHRAALVRMREIQANPLQTLNRIRGYMTGAFRRLYLHRNLVLHGAVFTERPAALRNTLDIAAPLIGAGLDRIVHAWLEREELPSVLAGKAEVRLALVGQPGERGLLDLLE